MTERSTLDSLRSFLSGVGGLFPSVSHPSSPDVATTPVLTERGRKLMEAERRMLRAAEDAGLSLQSTMVPISPPNDAELEDSCKSNNGLFINTLSVKPTAGNETGAGANVQTSIDKPNLVLVHGWGGGIGIFVNVLRPLSTYFSVHAIDLLGWGRSSRPKFTGKTPEAAQSWFVDSLESWRESMGLEKMVLCGHSMGGYVCASYALKYPQRVERLVLLSPIGLQGTSVAPLSLARSYWQSFMISTVWNLTPQRIASFLPEERVLRMLGSARRGVWSRFPYDDDTPIEYIARLALGGPVSGEVAFTRLLSLTDGWTLPVGPSLVDAVRSNPSFPPVTLAYGVRDWIDPTWAVRQQQILSIDRWKVFMLRNAGHHGYVEASDGFAFVTSQGHSVTQETTGSAEAVMVRNLEALERERPLDREGGGMPISIA
ncbi:Alpha/Beta hydrolase protein [Cladochytrium replicatum]|nr:Alpha/Beta hydrolase protein [Cladochytrium replicatum]